MKRVRKGSMLGGVLTGIAKYHNWNIDNLRLLTIILWFVSGAMISWLYIILWVFIDAEDE